jgi:tetratricopeptide (TPR) repeat protein
LAAKEHLQICPADLIIRHHAYLSVLTEDKVRWATRLLELELRDRPGQLHYRIEYGRNLLRLNDPQGHAVLAEAADQMAAAADAPVPPTPNVASLLEYLLTVSAAQSRSRVAPAQARQLAFRWFPQSPPLLWAVAQRAFQAGDHRDAAQLLESLVHLGRTGTYDRRAAFDPSLMAEPALLNLARSYVRLGQLDRAEALFREVLANPVYRSQAQEGCHLVNNLRRRPTDLPKPPP